MTPFTALFCIGLSAGAADLAYEQALEQALARNPTIQIAGAAVALDTAYIQLFCLHM